MMTLAALVLFSWNYFQQSEHISHINNDETDTVAHIVYAHSSLKHSHLETMLDDFPFFVFFVFVSLSLK